MDSFAALRRRTTDLFQSLPQSLPSMPALHAPRHTMKGTWEKISVPPIPRSSHTVNIIAGKAYIFGGEIKPREPVDNAMHIINLPVSISASADYYIVKASPAKSYESPADVVARPQTPPRAEPTDNSQDNGEEKELDDVSLASPPPARAAGKGKGKEPATDEPVELGNVPAPRVGHATAVIGSRIFLFGGRGGPEMSPLDERGRVWVFDTRDNAWSYLDPKPPAAGITPTKFPGPRSYHCAASTDKPREFAMKRPRRTETWKDWAVGDSATVGIPQAPIVGNVAADARDEETDGYGTFFIHGGCLASGERTNDLWAFDVRTRVWTELPAAPGPARGGAAICVSKSRLFRFGGYDGNDELGGQLDFVHLELDLFDDGFSKGEVAVHARSGWQSIIQGQPAQRTEEIRADDLLQEWPGNRSVAGLEVLTTGGGREYLILVMGERIPSTEGHEGVGKFWGDVWAFQVPPLGMTTASVKDAMLQAMGKKTGEGKWSRIEVAPYDDDNDDEMPLSRGWAATAPMMELEEDGFLMWGGLGENNKRLGDGWIFRLG